MAWFCCVFSLQILQAAPYGLARLPLRRSLFSPTLRSAPPEPPREPAFHGSGAESVLSLLVQSSHTLRADRGGVAQ